MRDILVTTPRLHDSIRLVSTRTAINCAGLFVVSTLMRWGARTVLRNAVVETEALVTAAVNATGIPEERMYWTELTRIEYITVQIYGFDESVRIEVWDSAPNLPMLSEETESPVKRGYYPTPRGKVVWVELPILPRRSSHPPQPASEQFVEDDPDLLRRVQDGLERL
jgi:hypothetical protein